MILAPTTVERIVKLIPVLASDKPGEVAAAASAIDRTLRRAGRDWHDLTAALTVDHGAERCPPILPRWTDRQLAMLVETGRATIARLEAANDLEKKIGRRLRRERDSERDELRRLKLAAVRARLVSLIAGRATVQFGRARDRRAAVLEILSTPVGAALADREIARRVGCSPQTVGNIRRRKYSAPLA